MTKRLLIICQNVDESDDILGFFVSWIREFARVYEAVTVITLSRGNDVLPSNVTVHSLGKERGAGKALQAVRLVRFLWAEVRRHDAVFAHMSPIFGIIAWPFTFIWRRKLLLWYLHRSVTMKLRLAIAASDVCVTADAASLSIRSGKIQSIGHGIDTQSFSVARDWAALEHRPMHIITVGRITPIKGIETLIRAVAHLREMDMSVELRIVGKPIMQRDFAYEESIRALIARLRVDDCVHMYGDVPYRSISEQYRWADIAVGCTPRGGIDKSLLEAMASGCIVLTSNTVMRSYLGEHNASLVFAHEDSHELAEKISMLGRYDEVSEAMVQSVRQHHDLKNLIERLCALT